MHNEYSINELKSENLGDSKFEQGKNMQKREVFGGGDKEKKGSRQASLRPFGLSGTPVKFHYFECFSVE
jgi:hypothetical protein